MQQNETDNLINNLMLYGLTPVQSQTYITLLKLRSATAKAISRNSGINRVDTYRALKRLKTFRLIEETLRNPTEFTPVPPDQALDILIASKLRSIEQLRATKADLARMLEIVSIDGSVIKDQIIQAEELFLKVLSGEQIFTRYKQLLESSNSEVLTILAPRVALIFDELEMPALARFAQKRNVAMRTVTNINEENVTSAVALAEAMNLRDSPLPSSQMRFTIFDRLELILAMGPHPRGIHDGTGLWTNSKILVEALVNDFEKLWANSSSSQKRIEELRQTVL